MRHRINMRRIFLGSRHRFSGRAIVETHVVNLMALVEPLQPFERRDLPAAAGGMKKIGFQPQNLHSLLAHRVWNQGLDFRSFSESFEQPETIAVLHEHSGIVRRGIFFEGPSDNPDAAWNEAALDGLHSFAESRL